MIYKTIDLCWIHGIEAILVLQFIQPVKCTCIVCVVLAGLSYLPFGLAHLAWTILARHYVLSDDKFVLKLLIRQGCLHAEFRVLLIK